VSTYQDAGVNIAAGNRAVELMKQVVQSTYGPEVLAGVGAFGGAFDASLLKQMDSPVLVSSTDGVGTKTKVAVKLGRYGTIGQDLVNHCVNDILVQGAEPLFFLDYVATAKLDPNTIASVVSGVAQACRENGCALLGGETAEMPGVYVEGELDLAGTIVGVVERSKMLDGSRVQVGDSLVAFLSSGLHTNGYSLARKLAEYLDWSELLPATQTSIGEALLAVHKSYLPHVRKLWSLGIDVHGMAHITGGGVLENLPRTLPEGRSARIRLGSWPIPPIFHQLVQAGNLDLYEMYRAFNMGLGFIAVLSLDDAARTLPHFPGEAFVVGQVVEGNRRVELVPL
jgi:phosphoribosylformylglycinamidine cyclo-ligase